MILDVLTRSMTSPNSSKCVIRKSNIVILASKVFRTIVDKSEYERLAVVMLFPRPYLCNYWTKLPAVFFLYVSFILSTKY